MAKKVIGWNLLFIPLYSLAGAISGLIHYDFIPAGLFGAATILAFRPLELLALLTVNLLLDLLVLSFSKPKWYVLWILECICLYITATLVFSGNTSESIPVLVFTLSVLFTGFSFYKARSIASIMDT